MRNDTTLAAVLQRAMHGDSTAISDLNAVFRSHPELGDDPVLLEPAGSIVMAIFRTEQLVPPRATFPQVLPELREAIAAMPTRSRRTTMRKVVVGLATALMIEVKLAKQSGPTPALVKRLGTAKRELAAVVGKLALAYRDQQGRELSSAGGRDLGGRPVCRAPARLPAGAGASIPRRS